jgi:hypothetical protein
MRLLCEAVLIVVKGENKQTLQLDNQAEVLVVSYLTNNFLKMERTKVVENGCIYRILALRPSLILPQWQRCVY